jgi:hypothetical protein
LQYILKNASVIGFELTETDIGWTNHATENILKVQTAIEQKLEHLPAISMPFEDIEDLLFRWGKFEDTRRQGN